MNKFEKQLEKWNNGILRGAQAKLAKCLQVSTATVALWATGQRHPSKGYMLKMAQLFNMDVYQVSRLFTTLTTYPEISATIPLALHENQISTARYSADLGFNTTHTLKGNVSLPVFMALAPEDPRIDLSKAVSWWIIPKEEAQQAQFLFSFSSGTSRRLLFMEPCNTWKIGKPMLARYRRSYIIVYVKQRGNKIHLTSLQGRAVALPSAQPLGVIVKQVVPFS